MTCHFVEGISTALPNVVELGHQHGQEQTWEKFNQQRFHQVALVESLLITIHG